MGETRSICVDAGFNNLARPILYGAYHPDVDRAGRRRRPRAGRCSDVVVGGPLCESGDIFTQEEGGFVSHAQLPAAEVGDLLVIEVAGAYGFVMGSNYNSKPLAAEVLIADGRAAPGPPPANVRRPDPRGIDPGLLNRKRTFPPTSDPDSCSMPDDWTLGRLLAWTTDYLKQQGAESPKLDVEVLLAAARGCKRIELYTSFDEPADEATRERFRELVKRRADNDDDGNGTMEAVAFGNIRVWGFGAGNGPWIMGDLENGLYAAYHLGSRQRSDHQLPVYHRDGRGQLRQPVGHPRR